MAQNKYSTELPNTFETWLDFYDFIHNDLDKKVTLQDFIFRDIDDSLLSYEGKYIMSKVAEELLAARPNRKVLHSIQMRITESPVVLPEVHNAIQALYKICKM